MATRWQRLSKNAGTNPLQLAPVLHSMPGKLLQVAVQANAKEEHGQERQLVGAEGLASETQLSRCISASQHRKHLRITSNPNAVLQVPQDIGGVLAVPDHGASRVVWQGALPAIVRGQLLREFQAMPKVKWSRLEVIQLLLTRTNHPQSRGTACPCASTLAPSCTQRCTAGTPLTQIDVHRTPSSFFCAAENWFYKIYQTTAISNHSNETWVTMLSCSNRRSSAGVSL